MAHYIMLSNTTILYVDYSFGSAVNCIVAPRSYVRLSPAPQRSRDMEA
jgi:hypothetical protein